MAKKKRNLTRLTRVFSFLLFDAAAIFISLCLSLFLKYEGAIPQFVVQNLPLLFLTAVIIKIPLLYLYGAYDIYWSYFGFPEMLSVFAAITISSLYFGVYLLMVSSNFIYSDLSPYFVFIDYLLTLFLVGGIRSLIRIRRYLEKKYSNGEEKVLIVGAGKAGEQLVREIQNSVIYKKKPVAFVDDDESKEGLSIHGVKVVGGTEDIPTIVREKGINEVIIAVPDASSKFIKRVVEISRDAGVKSIKIIPSIVDLLDGKVSLKVLREIRVEDLLGRQPVEIDTGAIESYIRGRRVLITGAAGSIGAELVFQCARFSPSLLVLVDQDETGIFRIESILREKFPLLNFSSYIADIRDSEKMEAIFDRERPEVVFHAAAYKHVPLMERNVDEAVKNNVFGTINIAQAALKYRTNKFVMISTDKAVNPTSVMGATKRVAEMVCLRFNERGVTKFISVRFGNVLGSRGSVLEIFEEQIRKGGPVTVTHPEMKRYFMTVSEAVLLVMQAGAMGRGGEVFVLNMGKPLKILDLAKETIRLSGFEPDKDIPIVFTGIRPGEKLFEELLTAEEGTESTLHSKIYRAKLSREKVNGRFDELLVELERAVRRGRREEIIEVLKDLVPTYKPWGIRERSIEQKIGR